MNGLGGTMSAQRESRNPVPATVGKRQTRTAELHDNASQFESVLEQLEQEVRRLGGSWPVEDNTKVETNGDGALEAANIRLNRIGRRLQQVLTVVEGL